MFRVWVSEQDVLSIKACTTCGPVQPMSRILREQSDPYPEGLPKKGPEFDSRPPEKPSGLRGSWRIKWKMEGSCYSGFRILGF